MRINPYFYIFDCTRQINRLGYPVIFYMHPWEFDSEHEKIELPINRKFMHYCNIGSTEKKIKFLLERVELTTVENVLGLKKPDKLNSALPIKHGKHYDGPYFKSALSSYLLVLSIYVALLIAAIVLRWYAFLIVIIFATVFYWPWGIFFNKFNILFSKKQ